MPVDVSQYGVIYAGAYKNAGPAGTTIVIVRDDLLGESRPDTPSMCNWKLTAETDSLYNTPPCFGIYKMSPYLDYLVRNGGVDRFYQLSLERSSAIYSAIDESGGFYTCPVERSNRSRMNVLFYITGGNPELEN
jgi:phosphoserine aminotransferase